MSAHRKIERSGLEQGFTLLEAIVALAIIGITLIPIMTFLANASRQLSVAADTTQRAFTEQALLAFAETINPLEKPTGQTELTRQLQLRWTTEEVVPPNIEARPGARGGDAKIGLYRINIAVIREEKEWFTFSVRKMGFKFNQGSMMMEMPQ